MELSRTEIEDRIKKCRERHLPGIDDSYEAIIKELEKI